MEEVKFKKFFNQIGQKGGAQLEATKAIIKVVETEEECIREGRSI